MVIMKRIIAAYLGVLSDGRADRCLAAGPAAIKP
jgi:hypothetical protein